MALLLTLLALLVVSPWPPAAAADPTGAAARWVPPLAGRLVVRTPFRPPATRWGAGHRGVDLAAYVGAVVRAAGAGEVTFAGRLAGRGVLVVSHGALRTTYEPVTPLVEVGTRVAAGRMVARLDAGHAGRSAGGEALLHWGLRRGRGYLDPLTLLPRGPSRLVPVPPGPAWRGVAPPPEPVPETPPVRGAARTAAVAAAFALSGTSVVGFALAAGALRPRRISRGCRRACRGAGGPPSCASGRCGSRSRRAPGRSPPA